MINVPSPNTRAMSDHDFCRYLRGETHGGTGESDRYLTADEISQGRQLANETGAGLVYGLCGGDYTPYDGAGVIFVTFGQLTCKMVAGVRCTVSAAGVVDYGYRNPAKRRALAIRVEELCRALGRV